MFGDEKTLSNVQHILAKQQDERNCIINAEDLGAGLDISLKYMMQFYTDTREVITGSEETSFSDTAGISGSSNEENAGESDNENGLVNDPTGSAAMVDSEISFLQLPVCTYILCSFLPFFFFSSFFFYLIHTLCESENFSNFQVSALQEKKKRKTLLVKFIKKLLSITAHPFNKTLR